MNQQLTRVLLDRGTLNERDLARAELVVQGSGEPIHRILCSLGLVAEEEIANALAQCLSLPLAEAGDYPATALFADRLRADFLRTYRVLPLRDTPHGVVVAMADPFDDETRRALELQLGKPVSAAVAVPAELDRWLEKLYGAAPAETVPTVARGDDLERLREMASDAPVIRRVNQLLERAVAARASDIHLEPQEGGLRLRHRVDGLLRDVDLLQAEDHAAIVSRVKILANLDIVERRLPQDGRCRVHVEGRAIDVRVSCLPTMHGESVVLRLLDKANAPLTLPQLGFSASLGTRLGQVLNANQGIFLVTGPTGSGKTTSLYAMLQQLNDPARKLITVEDPVEYELPGVHQMQVRPRIGLEFANVLRSVLRHDPDVIMVGEIRDLDTAGMAIQAALTGHLVLSTLHTNDAASAVTRLADMGVERYLMTSALRGVMAQRLVRTLCVHCRQPDEGGVAVLRTLDPGLDESADDAPTYRASGCERCGGTGFAGRQAIAELIVIDAPIRDAILSGADAARLSALAQTQGSQSMRRDGLRKVRAGVTSIDEVLRAVGEA
ncbi:MAG: GspE/PulE family protein [Proteobacteria bacterium]|nr:GspE/PulE family protein [Pseudomonadota bacterium]MDA1059568.1 GspE/PulE family protein [Pseudomonadota bacterium]